MFSVPRILKHTSNTLPQYLQLASLIMARHEAFTGRRGVKVQATELKPGNVVSQNGKLYQVVKAVHASGMGRQLGNVQVDLRELSSKRKLAVRHRPYDQVNKIRLESKQFQFLYSEGENFHMMDPSTYEQVTVDQGIFGEQSRWLSDGMEVSMSILTSGEVVIGEVPQQLTLEVKEAADYVRGDTASASSKTCILENGVTIQAPTYIQTGQRVVVNTSDGSFVRRRAAMSQSTPEHHL